MTRPPLILVVDDDAESRSLLGAALTAAGFANLSAADGQAGLSLAAQALPDLVVMDAVMPGIDGFQATRALKARPLTAHIPVVFMTGLSQTNHVVEGFRSGGVDYITKPIVLDELIARIRVHLSNAQITVSARAALDVVGRSLGASDASGALLWCTPQAASLIGDESVASPSSQELRAALQALLRSEAETQPPSLAMVLNGRPVKVGYLGRLGDERLFRLSANADGQEDVLLKEALNLTSREADVLVWIARGKSNKDISDILNISARTVNKHLEQIFTKLGVENRASAAAIATRIIAAQS